MSKELSLPPLIKDDVQGRLNMIILRPYLAPSLQAEQILEFRYCWWGSEYTHKIRLYPGCDDIRTVYDVRCDIKGLQRYFIDAEYLTVELSVVSDTESDVQQSHEHQIRKKKEWEVGDFIGKFSLSGLKLNARGEYIKECNIHNNYGDYLGSVMTFILYTSGSQLVSEPKQTKVSRNESQIAKISSKIKENNIRPQPTQITPKKNKVSLKEHHSPRFINLKNNSSVQCNISPQKISKSSQKLRENVKSRHFNAKDVTLRNSNDENSNLLSSPSFPNKMHIIKRLFSFVDSGALQLSDLPTLIQICQGRSPSLDLDSYDQIDDQIKCLGDYEGKAKEKVVFNEEFLKSLSSNTDHDPAKPLAYDSSTSEPMDLKYKSKDKSDNSEPSDEESSLLVLLFHSVQLNDQLHKKDVNQQKKKIVVRQRSKICYFVEIVLEFEDVANLQSTLLVSRQITETQEILFNSKKIFGLENGRDDGYLRFKVSSRQMGNQKPETVGIGIVSLNQIRSKKGNEKYVAIPLWASNENSNDFKSNNRSVEKPVGYSIFSVAFAMSVVSSHCDAEENKLQIDECSNSSSNDLQINDNFRTLQSGYKILEKDNIPPEKPIQLFENIISQESLIIEASSNVKYIPIKNMDTDSLKEVHLEIIEGNGLPLLRSKRTHASLQPNSYILTSIPPNFTFKTKIIKSSSSPVWNDRTNFAFRREDLEHTNFKLILKLFHSFDGESTQLNDPFLGFAPIDINFLWNSFLSLCGWIPLLDLDGNVCGEIKVSLTPRKSVCSYLEKPHKSDRREFDEPRKTLGCVNSFTTYDKDSDGKELDKNSRMRPGEFLPDCRSRNQLTKTHSITSENISVSLHDKLMKHNSCEAPSVTLINVDEEVKVEKPIVDFNEITTVKTEGRYNPVVIEAMQWMNHVDPLDSPYVSYLDMYSNVMKKETVEKPVKITNNKPPSYKKKCRIAANLNFLHDR